MSPRSGQPTRTKLLDTAESMILDRGYTATSIDQIIDGARVTKGTFFYHFKTKHELAQALIERWAAGDQRILRDNMARAEKLSDDPLQQLLIFVGLAIEVGEQLDAAEKPGCLFATYCYESGIFDDAVRSVISDAMLNWRKALGDKLRAAAAEHPPRLDVDLDSLADMITVVFEGAFTLARSVESRGIFAAQLRHYRQYLQLLFGT